MLSVHFTGTLARDLLSNFADHFSGHANEYARYRPDYPADLFLWLAKTSPATGLAWDCATGNGQAAQGLADHFEQVIATDASEKQIENAVPHDRVSYRVAPAEDSGLEVSTVDLITVAQALHWFDLDAFYREATRVLKTGGVLAIWSYGLASIRVDVDALIHHLYQDIVGPYWPMERRLVETGYSELTFPFREIEAPAFTMHIDWSLEDLTGYLRTWSAVKRFIQDKGEDPVTLIETELEKAWGNSDAQLKINWPLNMRVGING
jgi:SAM-dependent methyltransferase